MVHRDDDHATGPDDDPGDLDAELASARADADARRRRLRRLETERLTDEAGFGDVLRGLAATRQVANVSLEGGRARRGRIVGVGDDVVVMRLEGTHRVALLARERVSSVRHDRGDTHTLDGAASGSGGRLAEILQDWCAEGRTIRVWTTAGELAGRLVRIGRDWCAIEADGPARVETQVWLPSVIEVVS